MTISLKALIFFLLFLFFFDFLEVFHCSRSESRKVNKPRRNQKSKKKANKSRSWSRMPRPSDYLSQGLDFIDFLFFSRFFTFLLTWAFSPRTLIFLASWVSCPSPLSIFLAVLELWRTELQFCSPAKSVLQPRPAVLELLLEMPCLPVVWQPCQGSREACSGLSVQLLPSGLQF